MKTCAQFLTYVKYDFKRTDKDTEILQAYNDTLRHICNLAPMEGVKFQSWVPVVSGQEDYPLPTGRVHILHPARYIESSSSQDGYPLNHITKEEWSAKYPNRAAMFSGKPYEYCVFSSALLLGPAPDNSTGIIELDWAKIPIIQAADSDLQELGEEWEEVIKFGTLARLYESLGMSQEADRYWILYRDEELGYKALITKEKNQTGTILQADFRNL